MSHSSEETTNGPRPAVVVDPFLSGRSDIAEPLNNDAGEALLMTVVQRTIRSLAIDRMTARVSQAFEAAGINSILLKGPSIALWLYPAGAGRTYTDSDILVSPDAGHEAARVLSALEFLDVYAGATEDEQDPHSRPWKRPSEGICVDLHTSIAGVGLDPLPAWSALWRGHETMRVGGELVRVLNPVARTVHLALHAAHDGIANRQTVGDLERALKVLPMELWHDAALMAGQLAAMPSFVAGLQLTPDGNALVHSLRLPRLDSIQLRLRAISAPPLALGIERLREKHGLLARSRYVAENLVPTEAFMRQWVPLARRGPFGLLIAYIWRWAWLALHIAPAYRIWRRVKSTSMQAGHQPEARL